MNPTIGIILSVIILLALVIGVILNIHIDASDENVIFIWYGRKKRKNKKIYL